MMADNHPVFPQSLNSDGPFGGLTIREWFAGQALAGLMANANMPFASDYAECEPEQIADAAYCIADAMLASAARGSQPIKKERVDD